MTAVTQQFWRFSRHTASNALEMASWASQDPQKLHMHGRHWAIIPKTPQQDIAQRVFKTA